MVSIQQCGSTIESIASVLHSLFHVHVRLTLNARNKKLKIPRYPEIAEHTSESGGGADNTGDGDAEAEPAQRS